MESLNHNPTSNIVIGNCICCGELVRIPLPVDTSASARCPHCRESFALSAVLEQAIPSLELIVDAAPSHVVPGSANGDGLPVIDTAAHGERVEKKNGKFVVPPQLAAGAKRRRYRRHRKSENRATGGGPRKTVVADKATESASDSQPQSGSNTQPNRPVHAASSSPAIEVFKIAFGGMLALPVAQMLIWWFLGADPLNFGPAVSRVAPFVVPVEFRMAADLDQPTITSSGEPNLILDGQLNPNPVIPISTNSSAGG